MMMIVTDGGCCGDDMKLTTTFTSLFVASIALKDGNLDSSWNFERTCS